MMPILLLSAELRQTACCDVVMLVPPWFPDASLSWSIASQVVPFREPAQPTSESHGWKNSRHELHDRATRWQPLMDCFDRKFRSPVTSASSLIALVCR